MLQSCTKCHRQFSDQRGRKETDFVCSCCSLAHEEHKKSSLGLHPALEQRLISRINRTGSLFSHHFSSDKNVSHGNIKEKLENLSVVKHTDSNFMPKIPNFEIAYQIGKGAMGSVFRAREIRTGLWVAIKVLSHELAVRADLVARFERESFALKSLKNPNIVSIIASGQIEETHYFAMEYIDGITLRTRMNRSTISIKEAVFIEKQILNGLKTAHEAGIIHRDLKPENVLLEYGEEGYENFPKRVVLVDFGLVGIGRLSFDPHPNLTKSKVTMGTVNYMAPEQHIDAKRVDHRSDLYSAGVILFEMITGDLPLGRYQMPKERGIDISNEMETIMAKALARMPEERYFSAEVFFNDLNHIEKNNLFLSHNTEKIDLPSKNISNLKYFLSLANNYRYLILFLFAIVFFAFGIKFSLS